MLLANFCRLLYILSWPMILNCESSNQWTIVSSSLWMYTFVPSLIVGEGNLYCSRKKIRSHNFFNFRLNFNLNITMEMSALPNDIHYCSRYLGTKHISNNAIPLIYGYSTPKCHPYIFYPFSTWKIGPQE